MGLKNILCSENKLVYTNDNAIAYMKEHAATRAISRGFEKILSEYDTRFKEALTLFMNYMTHIRLT